MVSGASRTDVIGTLTRGLTFPLRPIAPEHLGLILKAIEACWHKLSGSKSHGDEKTVTTLLEPALNSHFKSDAKLKNLVSVAVRGKETPNFDAAKLEMRPDLSVFFKARPENFPLIIECKIIDHPNSKTTKLYCDRGIARFINGDYAWATREAIMLAYVRDGSSIDSGLKPHLAGSAAKTPDPFLTGKQPQADLFVHATAQYSEHGRSFTYTAETNGDDPGPITLWHLWL